METQTKQRLEKISLLLKDNGLVEHMSAEDASWLLELVATLGKQIDELTAKQYNYDKLVCVSQASRSLMIDLGRGNKDVSFPLAEIHNAMRILDGKDYLSTKPGIVLA